MTDPLTAITAGAILNLAFQEFAKTGAGELAKKSLGGAIDLAKTLRDKIRAKFQGDPKAETAIATLETDQSSDAIASGLKKLEVYLDDAMTDDASFANDLRQMAQQIITIQTQTSEGDRIYNQVAGRDIINIETIEGGSNKFGGT